MMKTKKSNKGLALVLAAVLALTPMAGFPLTALATGDTAAPKTEAPAGDAGAPQVDAPATDADANTDAVPGATPSAPAPEAETPQAETPATDAAQPAAPAPTTSAAIALTAPAAAVESAAASEGDVDLNEKYFPDLAFRNHIAGMLKKAEGDSISSAELLAVTNIDLPYNFNGENLKGIELFSNLKSLRAQGDNLTSLDLTQNKALTNLDITTYYSESKLTSLDVTQNKELTDLHVFASNLESLDVSNNTKLENLYFSSSKCGSIDVTKNTELLTLTLDLRYENHTGASLSFDFSQNVKLTMLNVSQAIMWVTSLDVSHNTELTSLDVSYNSLGSLDLTGLTKLSSDSIYMQNQTTNAFWELQGSPEDRDSRYVCKLSDIPGLGKDDLSRVSNVVALSKNFTPLACDYDAATGEVSTKELPDSLQYAFATDSEHPLDKGKLLEVWALASLKFDITATADANGTISQQGITPVHLINPYWGGYVPGEQQFTYTCTPNPGYELDKVTVDGKEVTTLDNTYTFTFPAGTTSASFADTAIHATFKKLPTANITASTDDNGTIDPVGVVEVTKGTDKKFTFTPKAGSELASVLVDDVEVPSDQLKGNTYTFKNVTAPHTIVATFKKIPPAPIVNFYSVTPTVENGTITPEHPTTVREGNSLKYTFSPKEGYTLESVSVNGKLVEATDESTTTKKAYSYTINSIYSDTTIHVSFKAVEPPVDPTDPVDPPKPPVDPTDPVDPPKPPVNPADPISPPIPPAVPDNGGNNGNNGGTTIVERTNTVTVPAAPQAAALAAPETPATSAASATAAAKTEAAPAKAAADNAAPQGQLENSTLGTQAFDMQHSHIPLALLLLAVWLVGGFAVIRQRKHTHDAIEGTSY